MLAHLSCSAQCSAARVCLTTAQPALLFVGNKGRQLLKPPGRLFLKWLPGTATGFVTAASQMQTSPLPQENSTPTRELILLDCTGWTYLVVHSTPPSTAAYLRAGSSSSRLM